MKQKTLQSAFSLSGKGLHGGKNVTITCCPTEANHGIKFQRIDIENQPVIDALASNVASTNRGTAIKNYNGDTVHTIEHLMASFAALNIYNVLVQIDGDEVPILNGSAQPFTDAILQSGIKELDAEQEVLTLRDIVRIEDKECDVEMLAIPAENFSLSVYVDYKTKILGQQHHQINSLDNFATEIAPCRTFCFLHEILPMMKLGLIKGGDLENAIIYVENDISSEEKTEICAFFNKENIDVTQQGALSTRELLFSNEVARHKLMDIVGDLALVGQPINAQIIARCPGHAYNTQLAKKLLDIVKKEKTSPFFDLTKEPLFTIEDIKRKLPHRPPFLLVDKIIEMTETRIIGVKNVTMNEPHFVGHFPEQAVMPGVWIMEGLAQAGGVLVLSTVPDPENYLTFFMKMDKVKFRKKVVPGDTLVYEMVLLEPIRRGICHMYGKAYVNGTVVAEGDLMAQITKDK